jgi:nucleoside-diphosphate-sugar epimerase
MSQKLSKIFVVGGTGAQGMPVVRGLVADKKDEVLLLSRDLKIIGNEKPYDPRSQK